MQYCLKQVAWSESDFFVQMTNTSSFSTLICNYSSENLRAIFLQTQKQHLKNKTKQYKYCSRFILSETVIKHRWCRTDCWQITYLNNREERAVVMLQASRSCGDHLYVVLPEIKSLRLLSVCSWLKVSNMRVATFNVLSEPKWPTLDIHTPVCTNIRLQILQV